MKPIFILFFLLLLTGCTSNQATADTCVDDGIVDASGGIEKNDIMFAPYQQFGMVYDENQNTLTYHGELVRWFEDYYPVGDGAYAGADFFNQDGTIDVYAKRDFDKISISSDGSYDPSGELTGLQICTQEEFEKRDIKPLLHPRPIEATAVASEEGEETETEKEIAAEYAPFGITWYDTPNGGWYYKGEKIYSFKDALTSNGESMSSGKFHGILRCFGSSNGTVSLTAIRDYHKLNAKGYGTLISIECSTEDPTEEITLSESPANAP